jgi:hypothetical protein
LKPNLTTNPTHPVFFFLCTLYRYQILPDGRKTTFFHNELTEEEKVRVRVRVRVRIRVRV